MPAPAAPLTSHIGHRRLVFLGMGLLFAYAATHLGPRILNHTAASDPWSVFRDFFSASVQPTLSDQNPNLPDSAPPFAVRLMEDWLRTLRYALIAMSLAIPMGSLLGFFSSHSWWPEGKHPAKTLLQPLYYLSRGIIAFMRSIHELIWVMFFYAAVGDEPITACFALAFPFAGTLAKVFSELIDEQSEAARHVCIQTGATPLRAFFATLLPQALPEIISYGLYRFECAIRSAAVLGFIGLETIGFTIKKSFENLYWNEVWTSLYLLIATVVIVELAGSRLRKCLTTASQRKESANRASLEQLRKTRPLWIWPRACFGTVLALTTLAWLLGKELISGRSSEERLLRLDRFFDKLVPDPVSDSGNIAELFPWIADLWSRHGAEALGNTLAIAAAAIVLAAAAAFLTSPWASRNLANAAPLGLSAGHLSKIQRAFWTALAPVTRWIFVMSRAVPEYIIAYLLIGILGPGAWPLVIALALHNFGILGRLWAEVIENRTTSAPASLAKMGGSRLAVSLATILPVSLNRFLLYFFYRWETCVREATILGMLGISSLGFHISLSREYLHYDRMLFYVLLGALSVIALDLLSDLLRKRLRDG